ncbi:ribosomal protein S18-alanine N-acetyltransferase [Bifidobacterium sp. N4G05]|uniref:ribosomal protein S18-alanine N-acetyltransferase n=1 Tax=Bifidobacterium sp. N4G05 TaxID=2013020 RepID=UPI000C158D98|nr:ribosomal protein S18-alanine N-acetyltransferase [Bifidobacterium sp. N4G05]PIB84748.1 ribosomal-protein-alanine N-acetyltransferase [Bifidobacterium sp. N4G05]
MIVDHTNIDEEIVVPQMAALEADLFGRGAWSEQSIRQEFHAPARTYLFDINDFGIVDCAAADGPVVDESAAADTAEKQPVVRGYAGFWYDGDDAEIMTIGVGKQFQRRGIAASLMEALIARAREQGAQRMLLEVRVDNIPALALYERFGFARMGLRKRYYQPEGIDAYTMSLDLEPRIVGFAAAEQ